MDFIKEHLTGVYLFFIPVGKKKREEILQKVRDDVAEYVPKIEERIGKDLGDLVVDDSRNSSKVFAPTLYDKVSSEDMGAIKKFGRKVLIYGVVTPFASAMRKLKDASLHYYENTIWVNFGPYMKMAMLEAEREGKDFDLKQGTVHEIGHHMWHSLGGEGVCGRNDCSPVGRAWSEGYSEYCSTIWFKDLYPEGFHIRDPSEGTDMTYKIGRDRVIEAVDRYGEDILLKIILTKQEKMVLKKKY